MPELLTGTANAVHYMENPILRFLKTNSDAYGLDKLFNAYNNLSNGISSETVELHLLKRNLKKTLQQYFCYATYYILIMQY